MTITQQFIGCGALAITLSLLSGPASSQDLYVYPANGQSDKQLAEDRYACHRWAVDESDFDPTQFSNTEQFRTVRVPVPRNQAEGASEKGALAGAVAGGVIGAHDSTVGKGAVIGAIVGSLAGAVVENEGEKEAQRKAREEAQRQAEEIRQNKAELALRRSNYRRAISACLEGRGYVVR